MPTEQDILSFENIYNGINPHELYLYFLCQSVVNRSYTLNGLEILCSRSRGMLMSAGWLVPTDVLVIEDVLLDVADAYMLLHGAVVYLKKYKRR